MWEEQGKLVRCSGNAARDDEDLARETELEIPVQVNGKIRYG